MLSMFKWYHERLNYKLQMTATFAFILGAGTLVFSYLIGSEEQAYKINYLICIFGIITGWIIGILATPYTDTEKQRFSNYTKVISAFFSGYLISKIDRIAEDILSKQLLYDDIYFARVIFFLIFFMLSILIVYVFRAYAK